jgi:hypothetical protein
MTGEERVLPLPELPANQQGTSCASADHYRATVSARASWPRHACGGRASHPVQALSSTRRPVRVVNQLSAVEFPRHVQSTLVIVSALGAPNLFTIGDFSLYRGSL